MHNILKAHHIFLYILAAGKLCGFYVWFQELHWSLLLECCLPSLNSDLSMWQYIPTRSTTSSSPKFVWPREREQECVLAWGSQIGGGANRSQWNHKASERLWLICHVCRLIVTIYMSSVSLGVLICKLVMKIPASKSWEDKKEKTPKKLVQWLVFSKSLINGSSDCSYY